MIDSKIILTGASVDASNCLNTAAAAAIVLAVVVFELKPRLPFNIVKARRFII